MMERVTPSMVMYAELKQFGRISNRDAAKIMLSKKVSYGKVAPADRVEERTFLSREIVRAVPGSLPSSMFADFTQSAQALTARMAQKLDGPEPYQLMIAHFGDHAADQMAKALKDNGLDHFVYTNAVYNLLHTEHMSAVDRATSLVLLFVVTGCLGDPFTAAQTVQDFVRRMLSTTLHTREADVGENFDPDASTATYGDLMLFRIVDGAIGAPHTLMPTEQGTIIGSLPWGESCITDVDPTVSKQHLRIYKKDGRWWALGLGSTNGTVVISGADKSEQVIELPKAQQTQPAQPFEIFAGDILCLAGKTRFMVVMTRV